MSGIFVGSAEISSIFVGSTEIAEVYLGSTKIWPSGSPSSFAVWDALRKGADVTLSESNLRAQIEDVEMVCGTNPQTKGSGLYYAEFIRNSGTDFVGFGMTKAGTATDQFNGAYSGQCTTWQDGSVDNGGGMDVSPNRPDYSALTGIKILFSSVGMLIGEIGGGWWSTITEDWTGDPLNNDLCIIRSMDPGDYSLAISSISNADITANFGQSAWLDTPPTGAVGWPA